MLINGVVVHHKQNVYRLYHPNGTVLADLRFSNSGDTVEESRIVRIMIKHLKTIWHIE